MNLRLSLTVVMFCIAILAGCGAVDNPHPSLEEYGFVVVMGYDYLADGKMKVTIALPRSSQQEEQQPQIFTALLTRPEEFLLVMSPKSEKTIAPNQLRVLLFSEAFAREMGLNTPLRWLYQASRVGDNVQLGIVKGSVEELMTAVYKNKEPLDTYLNDFLRPRRETAFQDSPVIHDFIRDTTSGVKDPTLPLLEKKPGYVEMTKAAVVRDGKLVGYFSRREGTVLQALTNRKGLAPLLLSVKDKKTGKQERVLLHFIDSKVQRRNVGSGQSPHFLIQLTMRINLLQYTGAKNLERIEELVALQEELNKAVEQLALDALQKCQQMGVDPTGMSDLIRAKYKGKWDKQAVREAWKKATFQIHVDVRLNGIGTVV